MSYPEVSGVLRIVRGCMLTVAVTCRYGLGCDRTTAPGGTGYAGQYAPANRDMFSDLRTCPTKPGL